MKLLALTIATSAALAAGTAQAGDANGRITRITAYGNAVIFAVDNHVNIPACDTDHSYVINASTSEGKTMYATLLSAVASGLPVSVFASSNTCPTWWSNSETPNSITLNP